MTERDFLKGKTLEFIMQHNSLTENIYGGMPQEDDDDR